ncbi:hypothetical protein D3C76_1274760 [compost metagenome]
MRQVLGRDAHVVIVEGVPQTVLNHAVDQLRMTHAQTGACLGQDIGAQAHVFLTASDHQLRVTATDGLHGQVNCLQARAADFVQGQGRGGLWQARLDGCLARGVLPGTCAQHLAEDHFIDLAGIDTGLLQQLTNYRGAQVGGGNLGQRSLEAADSSTCCSNDDDFVHVEPQWAI